MKEKKLKKPYGTGKVVGLSFVCVLLILVLTTALLGCVTLGQIVRSGQVQDAAASIALDRVTLSDGSSLAAEVNRSFLNGLGISDDKVRGILRDGSFRTWVGETAGAYADYLMEHDNTPFPEITAEDITRLVADNDDTIRLHTGLHTFSAEHPETIAAASAEAVKWNDAARRYLSDETLCGKLSCASVTIWPGVVLGVLLALVTVWLIAIHVRGRRHVGTAFKTMAVTAFVPSLVFVLAGLLGAWITGLCGQDAFRKAVSLLGKSPLTVGGIAVLGCIALFGFGVLWNAIAGKASAPAGISEESPMPETAPVPEPVKETVPASKPSPEPSAQASAPVPGVRKYCRFCGGELVNSDAMFCYKCGKLQENVEP